MVIRKSPAAPKTAIDKAREVSGVGKPIGAMNNIIVDV